MKLLFKAALAMGPTCVGWLRAVSAAMRQWVGVNVPLGFARSSRWFGSVVLEALISTAHPFTNKARSVGTRDRVIDKARAGRRNRRTATR